MAAARKMDELLVSWLGSDAVYESILDLIEQYRKSQEEAENDPASSANGGGEGDDHDDEMSEESPRDVIIPPFYPPLKSSGDGGDEASKLQLHRARRRRTPPQPFESWYPIEPSSEQPQQKLGDEVLSGPPKASGIGGGATGLSSSPPDAVGGAMGVPPPPPMENDQGGNEDENNNQNSNNHMCVRDQVQMVFADLGQDPPLTSPSSDVDGIGSAGMSAGADDSSMNKDDLDDDVSAGGTSSADARLKRRYLTMPHFARVTKDVFRFPSFFNVPTYQRILELWNRRQQQKHTKLQQIGGDGDEGGEADKQPEESVAPMDVVTYEMLEWYYLTEMEPYDQSDRFFRLVKQPDVDYVTRDDFLPFLSALLQDHPGLEFLSSHAEFQEKYAATVLARIFYGVDTCHSGKITSRQLRRSDLLEAFYQVDEEEDINKVTRYLSYEHFYVLYCRFWELDHDRDLRITREDLLKYGDHSLSHMIVDRIFDAAPRPFEGENPNRDYLTYESFIYFMLSEEDKSNEVAVRYWFQCVDVDGDGKLNNMEMRSFYAVQLHRMQCMGQEIVPFEDMLCQMMDMIKPKNPDHFVVEDFLQTECSNVSGALFDALFNLNKYLLFEQRDPFVERQKREDEFECDWDRFACIDYNRLAMEEEAREEEAMEIDWVTVDEDDDAAAAAAAAGGGAGGGTGMGGGGGAGTAVGSNDGYGGGVAAAGAGDPLGSVSEAPF